MCICFLLIARSVNLVAALGGGSPPHSMERLSIEIRSCGRGPHLVERLTCPPATRMVAAGLL